MKISQHKKNRWTLNKGFTLVELLVVIAIIGVLSALLMSNFIAIRQRARDAQRKSDLRQIQSALELYRADVGSYPPTQANNTLVACGTQLLNGTTIYMKKMPCDPLNSSSWYSSGSYWYNQQGNGGSGYELVACLENQNDKDPNITPIVPCNNLKGLGLVLYNP